MFEIKEPNAITAMDIHPSLLDGLIPVKAPVFFGIDGKTKTCKFYKFEYESENFPPLTADDMQLIHTAVTHAKKEGWKYLYHIIHGDGYYMRGC
jgi:hypothetical protein